MSEPTRPAAAPSPATFAVTREAFDAVPRYRARYILAYIVYVAGVFGPNFVWMAGRALLPVVVYPAYLAGALAYAVFAYNFFKTMRVMGYEAWFAAALAAICAPLFPGFLLLAYMDRRLATAWDAADPSGGYRQRPPTQS